MPLGHRARPVVVPVASMLEGAVASDVDAFVPLRASRSVSGAPGAARNHQGTRRQGPGDHPVPASVVSSSNFSSWFRPLSPLPSPRARSDRLQRLRAPSRAPGSVEGRVPPLCLVTFTVSRPWSGSSRRRHDTMTRVLDLMSRPPVPALDGDGDHGTRDGDVPVLGVLAFEQRLGSLVLLPVADNPATAIGANPPQLRPIVVIVVDEHCSRLVPTQVLEPLELERRLRLGVDAGIDRVPVENKAAWNDVGSPVRAHAGKMGHLGRRRSFSHHSELHAPRRY